MNTPLTDVLLKTAGAKTALIDLGLMTPDDTTKEAFAPLAGLAGLAGRGLWALGKGLFGAGRAASNLLARPFGAAGNRAIQSIGQRIGASPARIQQIQRLGQGMAREGMGFGLISGGLGAAMADPGQRGEAFLRGFGSGALGGLAWRGAGNLASAGIKRGLGKRFAGVEAASQQPWLEGTMSLGQRAKGWGAKALLGGVPFATGMGASMMMPTFEKEPQTSAQRFAPYAARMAGGTMMGAYPQHPMGYAYNPNLPMPQYGY